MNRYINEKYAACTAKVISAPKFAPLYPYSSYLETGKFTRAQLTDDRLPTPRQAGLFAERHTGLVGCRPELLRPLSTVRPDLVPPIVRAWAKGDAIEARLVARRISWGEANRLIQSDDIALRAALARRRARTNALAQSLRRL